MTEISDDAKSPAASTFLPCSNQKCGKCKSHSNTRNSNVYLLLARREISPRAKRVPRSFWGKSSKPRSTCAGVNYVEVDSKYSLISWIEAESLRHLSAKYCPLSPPPRSTIAAAFSSDGKTFASTHGDHTVKIIDCQTGKCLKVLSGHRRTPWVVRFHPIFPEILASGSLDHEVRLWDANTADCIGSKDFYRPIASIAFHSHGNILAVASGHKLYIWNYNRRESSPTYVLKTRRSLRAVHFHPHAAPFLLTAEVNDLDSPDTTLARATTSGYLEYPPPAMFFTTNIHSSSQRHIETRIRPTSFGPILLRQNERAYWQHVTRSIDDIRSIEPSSDQRQSQSYVGSQHDIDMTPVEMNPSGSLDVNHSLDINSVSIEGRELINSDSLMVVDTMESVEEQANNVMQRSSSSYDATSAPSPSFQHREMAPWLPIRPSRFGHRGHPSNSVRITDNEIFPRNIDNAQLHQLFPSGGDSSCWDLPFLQGWLMGQTNAGLNVVFHGNSSLQENSTTVQEMISDALRSGLLPAQGSSADGVIHFNVQGDGLVQQSSRFNVDSEITNSVSSDSTTELPCTVKLRIWSYDMQKPSAPLDSSTCRLVIPHAVLCSEMGAHFSPCGRFLAACVACVLPHSELDPGLHTQSHHDTIEAGTSPTRHPISGHRVIYELRVYSLEEATFGMVLASRAIRAAHCLTSIQFSPTSEHILVAYGRRHTSLLRSFVTDGEAKMHIYTILEVYRVSDMELVRVLPSAEDEVNVACFHPLAGCGLVYGTKEGKLRILQYNGQSETKCAGGNTCLDENMLEIQTCSRVLTTQQTFV